MYGELQFLRTIEVRGIDPSDGYRGLNLRESRVIIGIHEPFYRNLADRHVTVRLIQLVRKLT